MKEDETHFIENFVEIPDTLKSFETGQCLSHCVDCGVRVIENGSPYLIQKAFKGSEVIVEYAQCFSCYERLTESYSKQTMSEIWNFFLDTCDFEERKKRLLKESPDQFDAWVDSCIVCEKTKKEASSYSIVGQCDGPHLLFYYLPYMICDKCQMRMHELMSSKSRDIWDRWMDEHIGTPPTMENDFTPGKLLFA